ncbi:solute carrier family 2, facilitated glucose transporter member 8-like [Dermacentor andersoni]|uniref:solute carrier family 2, facilitated glucose transporter member 8-like n=1 Tax=Dermacentor andersoni TaxID=34620 RepID=UPI003B3AF497
MPFQASDSQSESHRRHLSGPFLLTLASAWSGSLCMGMTLGYTSPAASSDWAALEKDGTTVHSATSSAWFIFLLPIGAVLGTVLGALVSQAMGRRFTLLLSAVVYVAGYVIIFANAFIVTVLFGRFVTGIATGMVSLCVPAYIAEVSLPAQRGSMGGLLQLAITVGILYSYTLGRFLEWQLLAVACLAGAVLLAALNQYSVESPRWLMISGRRLDVLEVLWKLRGSSGKQEAEMPFQASDSQSESHRRHLSGPFLLTLASAWSGSLCMGMTLGYTSPAASSDWAALEKDGTTVHSATSSAWFIFLLPIGAVLGTVLGALVSQAMGRRFTLLLSAVVYVAGYVIIFANAFIVTVLFGRFVTGIATGMVSLCVPAYIAEVSLPAQRGSMGGLLQLAITVGILYSYTLGRFLEWQLLAVACLAGAVLLAALNQYSVESPRWLMISGRRLDVLEVLWKLRGSSGKVDEEFFAIEQVFAHAPTRFAHVLLATHAHFIQQFSGINTIIFYAHSLSIQSGISISTADCSIIVASLQARGMRVLRCLSAAIFVFFFFSKHAMSRGGSERAYTWQQHGYSLGLGPVVWILGAELVCCRDRGMHLASVCAFNWACVLLITWFSTSVRDTIHLSGLAWFFSLVTTVGAVLLMLFMPETQGQSLEQILLGHFRQPEGSSGHSPKASVLKRM